MLTVYLPITLFSFKWAEEWFSKPPFDLTGSHSNVSSNAIFPLTMSWILLKIAVKLLRNRC